jgi:hypothetical protein
MIDVHSLAEFVYTGDFKLQKYLSTMDPWDLLDELLELLA